MTQPTRASFERQEIFELQDKSAWLSDLKFRLTEDFSFEVDFSVSLNDSSIALTMCYPALFPNLPPKIVPKENVRVSSHQYGEGGELCLEYRTDNWTTDITGAIMIESAYKLISNEQDASAAPVPSAHRTLVGQNVRNSVVRFLLPPALENQLASLAIDTVISAAVSECHYAGTCVSSVCRIGTVEAPLYNDPMPLAETATIYESLVVRVAHGWIGDGTIDYEELVRLVGNENVRNLLASKPDQFWFPILLADGIRTKLIVIWDTDGKQNKLEFHTVRLPANENRLAWEVSALSQKLVAVVGCGSVGSKVAVSLARSGVRNFLLLDTDLFFKPNLVRNELDRRAIGLNKTKALKARLIEVAEGCSVECRDLNLGGQESASWTIAAVNALARADLIVDATANASAFNLCATVSTQYSKPLIWGLVYSGGIGGLVARARPNTDPTPLLARKQIFNWYDAQGVPWDFIDLEGYDIDQDNQAPLIASDAEVSIVAAHMTRFAFDALLGHQESWFPCSAYAIGFKQAWIFSQPMQVWPISLSMEGSWGPVAETDAAPQLKKFIEEVTGSV